MNWINGWKGYLMLSIALLCFAIAPFFSKGLPIWFQITAWLTMTFTSGMAARASRELYKKSKK